MKMILTILILSMKAYSFELIDSKKFKSLSRDQQVKYITEVQKIVVGLTKKSSYSAEAEKTTNRNPANNKPDLDDWSAPSSSFAPPPTSSATAQKPNKPVAEPATAAPKPELVAKKKAEPNIAKPKAADVEQKTTPAKVAATKPKAETKDSTHFRCMHSGFVIEKDPCTGYQKIPDGMGIDGLDEKNKSCPVGYSVCNPILFGLKFDNPDKCKSLLDGECSKTAKPFCALRVEWPTEACYKMATANNNLGTTIAAEINSDIKPELYEKFQEQMKGLCDPEKIKTNPFAEFRNRVKRSDKTAEAVRKDLTETCGWASKQIEALNMNASIVDSQQSKEKDPKPGQK